MTTDATPRPCAALYTSSADLERLRAEHESVFGDEACPQWAKDSLTRYVQQGIPTGDFLRAVLANDLQGAFARADIQTARIMAGIVGYVWRRVPVQCRGSHDMVDAWVHSMRSRVESESQR